MSNKYPVFLDTLDSCIADYNLSEIVAKTITNIDEKNEVLIIPANALLSNYTIMQFVYHDPNRVAEMFFAGKWKLLLTGKYANDICRYIHASITNARYLIGTLDEYNMTVTDYFSKLYQVINMISSVDIYYKNIVDKSTPEANYDLQFVIEDVCHSLHHSDNKSAQALSDFLMHLRTYCKNSRSRYMIEIHKYFATGAFDIMDANAAFMIIEACHATVMKLQCKIITGHAKDITPLHDFAYRIGKTFMTTYEENE